MYLPLLCNVQEVVSLSLNQLVHVLDLLSGYLHGPNVSVIVKQEATKRSEESSRWRMLFRMKHQCRASQVFVFVKGEFSDRSISVVVPKGQENLRVMPFRY